MPAPASRRLGRFRGGEAAEAGAEALRAGGADFQRRRENGPKQRPRRRAHPPGEGGEPPSSPPPAGPRKGPDRPRAATGGAARGGGRARARDYRPPATAEGKTSR